MSTTRTLVRTVLGTAALALALSACGSPAPSPTSTPGAATVAAAAPSGPETVSPDPAYGPAVPVVAATGVAEFPAGLTAEIARVTEFPADDRTLGDEPTQDARVTVVIRLTATEGALPLVVSHAGFEGPEAILLYGPNQQEAQKWLGDNSNDSRLVSPGAPVEFLQDFTLPSSGLSSLLLSFTPDRDTVSPIMFGGVESIVH